MKIARISKIAGISLAGFVVATFAADKVNAGPAVAQVAGFLGGLIGTLVGRRKAGGAGPSEPARPSPKP